MECPLYDTVVLVTGEFSLHRVTSQKSSHSLFHSLSLHDFEYIPFRFYPNVPPPPTPTHSSLLGYNGLLVVEFCSPSSTFNFVYKQYFSQSHSPPCHPFPYLLEHDTLQTHFCITVHSLSGYPTCSSSFLYVSSFFLMFSFHANYTLDS